MYKPRTERLPQITVWYFHVKAFLIEIEMLFFSLLTLSLSLHLVHSSDFADDLAQCAASEQLNVCLVKVSAKLNSHRDRNWLDQLA